MRTIRRKSYKLNTNKWKRIQELVLAYAKEKDAHLLIFGNDATFAGCASDRDRRDLRRKSWLQKSLWLTRALLETRHKRRNRNGEQAVESNRRRLASKDCDA